MPKTREIEDPYSQYPEMTSQEIARQTGYKLRDVRAELRRRGVLKPRILLHWDIPQLLHWYEAEGLSSTEIGRRLGRDARLVRKALHRAQAVMKPVGPYGGDQNPAWNGGKTIDKSGYVLRLCRDHPYANNAGYVREHRLVMEKTLGRYLLPSEVVHHLNDDKQDNRPSNLKLYATNGKHL